MLYRRLLDPDSVKGLAATAHGATTIGRASHPYQRIAVGAAADEDLSESDAEKLPFSMATSRVWYGDALLSQVTIGFRTRDRRRPPMPQLVVRTGRRQRAVAMEAVWVIMRERLVSAESMIVLADEGERRQARAESDQKASHT